MTSPVNWSFIQRGRDEFAHRYGTFSQSILTFPTVSAGRQVLLKLVKSGDALLDIGANDRNVERYLRERGINVQYFSYDPDRTFRHDFYDVNEIDRKFDVCTAFDVVEHIPLGEVIELFSHVHKLLVSEGHFVVSTPNVCHPVIFWRDCTHITALRYDELGGLLVSAGFQNIQLYRVANTGFRNRVRYWRYKSLLKLLDIDFTKSIVMVAQV